MFLWTECSIYQYIEYSYKYLNNITKHWICIVLSLISCVLTVFPISWMTQTKTIPTQPRSRPSFRQRWVHPPRLTDISYSVFGTDACRYVGVEYLVEYSKFITNISTQLYNIHSHCDIITAYSNNISIFIHSFVRSLIHSFLLHYYECQSDLKTSISRLKISIYSKD